MIDFLGKQLFYQTINKTIVDYFKEEMIKETMKKEKKKKKPLTKKQKLGIKGLV